MWTKVCKVSDMQESQPKIVEADGKPLALFKAQGAFYALDNTCPHRGGPLGEGYLEGVEVTCPWHAWTFDVTTGQCQTVSGVKQKTYPVKAEGGDILIDI